MAAPSRPPLRATAAADRDVAVLAVDDQASFRDVLREVIAATSGFVLVGEACSGAEALAAVDSLSPELVMMDVRMPGMDGVTATQAIMASRPQTVVVLISAEDPDLAPGVDALGGTVARVRKQHLRPQLLRDIWEGRDTPEAAHEPSQPTASMS